MQALNDILATATSEINAASDLTTLDQLRLQYLGKKGLLTEYLKTLGTLPAEERPAMGQAVNTAKEKVQQLIQDKTQQLKNQLIHQKLAQEKIDITLPGRGQSQGTTHPITRTIDRIQHFFHSIGYQSVEGPEIEDDYHNFLALNIPEQHPARAMADTFYLPGNLLLRTHTSPVQVRVMENTKPPIKIIVLGKAYRCDLDATHSPMFHQIECLAIDEHLTFANLKGLLIDFMHHFFERSDLAVRFRPSYFPFTEPSAEIDLQCFQCHGKGCNLCKHTGWIEILGCGMVHPRVLEMSGIDSERYTGYAFGGGIDRLTMLRYGIPDLRLLFENDIRLLSQF